MHVTSAVQRMRAKARKLLSWGGVTRLGLAAALFAAPLAHAEFVNGGFETGSFGAEWIRTPLKNGGVPTVGTHAIAPKSIKDLNLQANAADAGYDATLYGSGGSDATNLSVVMDAGVGNPPRSQPDPLLNGGSPSPTLRWPFSGRYGALVNLDPTGSTTATRHIARTGTPTLGNPAVQYTGHGSRASSIRQRVQVTAADVDTDGKVHVRFAMTPVLDNPGVLNALSGSATVLAGTPNIVTGTGTNFMSSVQVGTYVYLNPTGSSPSSTLKVVSVDSDTQLTLSGNATAVSGAAIYVSNAGSGHFSEDQPYFAVEVRKITSGLDSTPVAVPGAPASSPGQLFFTFNFSNQPGTVWHDTANNSRNYAYSDFITFDIAPGNAKLKSGDWIELELVASGCAPGGHEGHVHVDNFSFGVPDTLWVSVSGPVSVSSANGTQITYTYTYTNKTGAPVDNVTIKPVMPQDNTAVPQDVTFVSSANGSCTPSGGAAATPATPGGALSCNVGTVPAGGTGTFTVTVTIPNGATGPINNGNYTIEGDGVAPLGGPKWETSLVSPATLSDMKVDVTGLPGTATVGTPYTGTYTCENIGSADALVASCDAANLPAGLTPACTIDGVAWSQPGTVPVGKKVICQVTGTPTTAGNVTVQVTTGADNDPNTLNNSASVPFSVAALPTPDMAVDLTGLPSTAVAGQNYSGSFTCRNIGTANATAASCTATALPSGVLPGACTIDKPVANTPWSQNGAVPQGATVTCQVSGKVDVNATNTTINGATNATGDSNAGNNTATKAVTVTTAPNVVVTPNLPPTATVGVSYNGSYTCTNNGSADATNATCAVSALPPGVSLQACTISPGNGAWTQSSTIPVGQTVTCTVTGKPTTAGPTNGNATTTATGTPGDAKSYAITVAAVVVAPSAIPTLSEWGLIILSGLLALMGLARRRHV